MILGEYSLAEMLFGACAGTMNSMALLLGSDYETVNVILFDIIEPGLVALLLVGVLLSLFRKARPAARAVGWLSVGVIALVIVALIVSAIAVLPHIQGGVVDQKLMAIGHAPEGSFIHSAFEWTVDFLMREKTVFGTTYYALNLWLYVAVMPALILAEQLIIFRQR